MVAISPILMGAAPVASDAPAHAGIINIPAQISAIAKTTIEKVFFNATTSFYFLGIFCLPPQYVNSTSKEGIFHLALNHWLIEMSVFAGEISEREFFAGLERDNLLPAKTESSSRPAIF
jgi:hypothetical protein